MDIPIDVLMNPTCSGEPRELAKLRNAPWNPLPNDNMQMPVMKMPICDAKAMNVKPIVRQSTLPLTM